MLPPPPPSLTFPPYHIEIDSVRQHLPASPPIYAKTLPGTYRRIQYEPAPFGSQHAQAPAVKAIYRTPAAYRTSRKAKSSKNLADLCIHSYVGLEETEQAPRYDILDISISISLQIPSLLRPSNMVRISYPSSQFLADIRMAILFTSHEGVSAGWKVTELTRGSNS